MTDTGDNLGWDDPEDTLPPFPEQAESYGPDIPSQRGDFRFTRTTGEAWADPNGVEVRLSDTRTGAVRFHVDRPTALRVRDALEKVLAVDPRPLLLPDFRPPELSKCPDPPHDFVLHFTADDEPRLTVLGGSVDNRWLYLSLSTGRASLSMQLEDAVAFHLYDWISDAERIRTAGRRALGRVLCEVNWPACPSCLGESLHCSGGIGSCVWCGGKWLALSDSCNRVATHELTDSATGRRLFICASHAQSARQELDNSVVVEPIPAIFPSLCH